MIKRTRLSELKPSRASVFQFVQEMWIIFKVEWFPVVRFLARIEIRLRNNSSHPSHGFCIIPNPNPFVSHAKKLLPLVIRNANASSAFSRAVVMSSFYSRNSRAIWLTLAASGVYFLYRYYEYKRRLRERNERIAAGLELFSRRGVEKLVELRDKLVCVMIFS